MTGATLAAVDVFLAYISVVIFFLSVSLLLFCYWRYSGRVRRALMPRDGRRRDGRRGGRTNQIRFPIGANAISSSGALKCRKCKVGPDSPESCLKLKSSPNPKKIIGQK